MFRLHNFNNHRENQNNIWDRSATIIITIIITTHISKCSTEDLSTLTHSANLLYSLASVIRGAELSVHEHLELFRRATGLITTQDNLKQKFTRQFPK